VHAGGVAGGGDGQGAQRPVLQGLLDSAQRDDAVQRVHQRRVVQHMNLTISGHHLEVTPALRNYVTTKLDRITRHFDQVVDIKVLLTVEKQKEKERRQRAECNDPREGQRHVRRELPRGPLRRPRRTGRQARPPGRRHKTRMQDHHCDAPKRVM
jgi:putative sigma-54 modulation protein